MYYYLEHNKTLKHNVALKFTWKIGALFTENYPSACQFRSLSIPVEYQICNPIPWQHRFSKPSPGRVESFARKCDVETEYVSLFLHLIYVNFFMWSPLVRRHLSTTFYGLILTNQTYKPYTLVGPNVTRPVSAVLSLDNRLYIPYCVV